MPPFNSVLNGRYLWHGVLSDVIVDVVFSDHSFILRLYHHYRSNPGNCPLQGWIIFWLKCTLCQVCDCSDALMYEHSNRCRYRWNVLTKLTTDMQIPRDNSSCNVACIDYTYALLTSGRCKFLISMYRNELIGLYLILGYLSLWKQCSVTVCILVALCASVQHSSCVYLSCTCLDLWYLCLDRCLDVLLHYICIMQRNWARCISVCSSARLSVSWIAYSLFLMPLLGCCAIGENMTTLHHSSVMFYTGSQFLFASSLIRSVCWCTSRFTGLRLGTCASFVRRRIHPLRG